MATTKLLWYGRSFERHLLRQATNAVRAGGEAYAHQIRDAIDTIGPPRSHGGEPPHIDHGDLLKSIVTVVSAAGSPSVTSRTGSTSDHALPLELGTRKMSPRPFILKTLFDSQSIIVGAMAGAVRP
jgi:hypothetical protein